MKNVKRSLSALLAVVMVFTTMAVAFTVSGSAAPNVPRVPATRLSPTVVLTVPDRIETWGSDYYSSGSNVKPGGEIQVTITSHVAGASVQDISLQCSDAGIQLSPRQAQGEGGSVWSVQGGVLKTAPADDGSTVVKWTVSCTIAGKTYVTYAWSQVQPRYGNPGFATYIRHKNSLSGHTTYNHHVEWIGPVFGDPATETAEHYTQCYINESLGQHTVSSGIHAASYYWDWNQGSGDDETHTAALTAKGTLYVDVSQKATLTDVGLAATAMTHASLEDPDNHPQSFCGASITQQSINGNTTTAFSLNSPGKTGLGVGQGVSAPFSGNLPAAGGTAKINSQIHWEGQITRVLGITQKSYHDTLCNYQINIVTYDKTALKTLLDDVTTQNCQQAHFRNTAPAGNPNSAFRTWDEYFAALQNAWTIYGKVNVTQAEINAAISALNAALPKYNASTGAWQSGMMYADADYSQINTIKNTIADTLDPDFYEDYSDGTHGKYYQYTLASALNEALDDIDYEMNTQNKLLDARYQAVVDQMRANLTNAINGLIETNTNKTTKLISLQFVANMNGVENMPQTLTTSLTGQFQRPATNPTKLYYAFVNWYYDAACTQPVTWPIYINPNSPYFQADLDVKNDNAGVAYTVYAGWRVTGKSLVFDTQGGSPIETYVGADGAHYAGPTEVPTKTGCRFLGWYTDTTFTTPVDWDTFTMGSLNTVYARWAENSFTVTFNANGGKFADDSPSFSVTDLYGTPIDIPLPPSKENTGFDGWYYDLECTHAVDMSTFTIPDGDIQVFAKWNTAVRNLVIDPQNGEQIIVGTYDVGTRIKLIDLPVLVNEGFQFVGWYRNPEGKGSPQSTDFSLTSSRTLYAIWEGLPVDLIFDPNGGTMGEDFYATDYEGLPGGSELIFPEDPTMPEYVFTGWTLNGEPYTDNVVPAATDEADTFTFVATWEEEPYVATFRLRTDADEAGTVEQGDVITATVSLMANRYVTNHRFVVYYDNRYLQPALNGQPVTSNITGTSACNKIAGRAYFTLVRNPGGGTVTDCGTPTGRIMPGTIAPATQFFPADWVIDNTTLKDEYSHYEFVYFDAPDVSTGKRYRPTQEQDLASFQFIVRSDAPIADGVTNYAQLLLSEDFTRTPDRTDGKIAACLMPTDVYTNTKNWNNTTNVVVDGDHRFAVTQMQACRINFITNGGASLDAIDNAKQGGTVKLPTPTRDYYNFAGWTLTNDPDDTDYVNATAFPVPYADAITLYAKWTGKQVSYYVRHHRQTLDASGFMETYEQQTLRAAVGTTVTATAKTYDGFTCNNPNESGVVRGETSNPLVLDLWYMRKSTTITLDANGGKFQNGQSIATLTGLFDNPVANVPADPTREGYTFSSWEQDTVAYSIDKYPANDLSLSAKWTPKTITLRFYLDGSTTPYQTLVGAYGTEVTAPTVSVNQGQVFSGWKTANGVPFNYTTYPATDMDFYGSIGIDSYLLTLYVNGNQYGEPIEVLNGTQVTEATVAYTPDAGYRFTGWRLENSADGARASFPMTLSADTSLFGFTERETYSITTYILYPGDEEYTLDQVVDRIPYGRAFDLPEAEDYTDMGYGFRGWYTDPEMTTLYQKPATMPAENLVLYGTYYEMVGTIKFSINGGTGTAPADITRPVGTTVNTLPDGTGFSRKYYSFGGWSASPTGTVALTKYTISGEDPVTLYAIWNVNYATVSFNLNGAESGTRPESIQLEVGESIAASALPSGEDFVKTGFIFSGWSDKANATAGLQSYAPTTTGVKTLFAVWVPDKVTLIAKAGSTTVIDDERGFIYGLDFNLLTDDLLGQYLEVEGNGHLEYDTVAAGTGTVVSVINDFSGNVDATYTIVIFGDLNGDGMMTSNDITQMRALSAGMVTYPEDSANYFAADVNHDDLVNTTDTTVLRSAAAGMADVSQVPA